MIGWLVPHMPVLFGLAAGTLAKFGLDLDGGQLTGRRVLAHLMMLGTIGLLAEAANEAASCAPTLRAVIGSGAALLSTKLVTRFRAWADHQAGDKLPRGPA